jgi:hypothetical protein
VVVVHGAAHRFPVNSTKTAVILLFDIRGEFCYLTSTLIDRIELDKIVGCWVVLLEDFYGSARWDVLPAGREVRRWPIFENDFTVGQVDIKLVSLERSARDCLCISEGTSFHTRRTTQRADVGQ